jgi:hypothetical protein
VSINAPDSRLGHPHGDSAVKPFRSYTIASVVNLEGEQWKNPDRMNLTPNPCLQNDDIGTGAAKAARSLAISPGKMIEAISRKVLGQASIAIPLEV